MNLPLLDQERGNHSMYAWRYFVRISVGFTNEFGRDVGQDGGKLGEKVLAARSTTDPPNQSLVFFVLFSFFHSDLVAASRSRQGDPSEEEKSPFEPFRQSLENRHTCHLANRSGQQANAPR